MSAPQQPAEVDPAAAGRRLAALAAIALELAAALVALVAVFARPGAVFLSVLAVGVSAYGLIVLLLRSGAIRWLGALVLLLGVTGAVLLLFAGDLIVVLAVIFLLSALSAAAATFALRPRPYRPPERPVPPPARPFLLMNRWSGGGKVGKFKLDEQARSLGAEVVMLKHGMDVVETVENAVKDGADLLGAAGGDGTQALVAEVAARHDLPMLVVPAGTRNHFALDLGLDRDDPRAAIAVLGADAVEIRIDLGRVADRPFVNNVSLGVYAEVISNPEYRDAKLTTALKALPDAAGVNAESGLRVQTPDGRVHADPELVQIGNNPYEYRNVKTSGRRLRLDSGRLGIELIDYDSRSELERVIRGVASGHVAGAERDGLLARWTAESLTVEGSSGVVHAGVDGEYLTLPSPLVMSCQAGALRVRVPTDRPGLPAPPLTSSVATLRALWSLARGRPA